jgi:hypothetical protein
MMLRFPLPARFAAAALVCVLAQPAAAAPVPAPKPAPAKPAPANPGPAPAAAAAPTYNAQDPASLVAVLTAAEAEAEVVQRQDDGVLLKVTSPAGGFLAQFAGCNAQGKACKALQFDAAAERSAPTLAQVNGFNQSSMTCRIVQDRAQRPHVLYSTLLFPGDTRQEMLTQLAAWQACLGDFGAFLKDPPGYLASAP